MTGCQEMQRHCDLSAGKQSFEPKTKPRGKCKFVRYVNEYTKLFLESSSIRGCNRIVKTNSRFLKLMWTLYLAFTTLALLISTFYIVVEYLGYAVNMQSYIEMDTPRHFPDVTFCNHEPFSEEALTKWKSNEIRSPTKFNKMIRNHAATFNISNLGTKMYTSIVVDSLTNYYQVLDWPEHLYLGHTRNSSIVRCMLKDNSETMFAGAGCYDRNLKIETISHPYYFNCFTLKVQNVQTAMDEMRFLIWLGPDKSKFKNHTKAFIFDLFQQAIGIKVVLHEPDTMPSIDRFGINIEPGRMNELNFRIEETRHVHSVKNPCYESENNTKISDLRREYKYDFEVCVKKYLQKLIVKHCNCLYLNYPRIHLPSKTLPYCGRATDESGLLNHTRLMNRVRCVGMIVQKAAYWRKKVLKDDVCQRTCRKTEYKTTDSVTRWRSTDWQLYWTEKLSDHFVSGQEELNDAMDEFLHHDDLDSYEKDNSAKKFEFSDRYTYVIIKRESNDTIIHREQLVLTLSALFSRIGGICSLYIGLTLAVIIELLEFLYYSCKKYGQIKVKVEHNKENGSTDDKFANSSPISCTPLTKSDINSPMLPSLLTTEDRIAGVQSIWEPLNQDSLKSRYNLS